LWWKILSSDVNRKGSSDETNSGFISLQTNGEREKEKNKSGIKREKRMPNATGRKLEA
jgi:hypothetical protein